VSNFVTRRPEYDVQREIKRFIIAANLTVGDALPTEAELTAQLGVSRGSLREALKSLEARGIVEVLHGRGTYVGRMSMDALVDGLAFHTQLGSASDSRRLAAELIDVRDLIESALIQRVGAAPASAALEELEQIVVRMEDVTSTADPFQDLDRDFHRALYEPLDNRVVTLLIKAFWDVLEAARPALPPQLDDRVADAAHHRAILEAIRLGDPSAAYEAMTAHFASTHRWIEAPATHLIER
jgi:DNA-binding FadR family transcriptional regulator